jgi:NADH-quinone oxidoreductase subunit H
MSFDPLELLKSILTLTVFEYLGEVWAGQPWAVPLILTLKVLVLATFCLLIVIFLIWLERKVLARIQDRIGPNRVGGRYGLLQTVADVLKLLTKEVISPSGADFVAYNAAPLLVVMASLLMWAVMPFAPGVIGVNLNIGLFYVLAVSSASVVALLLAGWGSNNKYALLGAFRAVAQLVSYEVPMILSLLVPIILARSMATVDIINAQALPFILYAPISALIFYISSLAETGRTPFDLLEAESEIIAGFHVEYGGMKYGMFMLAEFVSTLFMSAFFTTIYLGGYRLFGLENLVTAGGLEIGRVFGLISFFAKTFLVYFVFMWIRGTLPRVRVDQILGFNWKFLVPLSLVLILTVAIVDKLIPAGTPELARMAIHLASNVLLAYVTLELLRWYGRRVRDQQMSGRISGGDGDTAHEALDGREDTHAPEAAPAH